MTTLDSADHWKQRCATLLKELESQSEESELNEKLLSRTIIRLSLAVKGLDTALDPHLTQIRNLLKKGIRSEKLRHELDALTDTLMQSEERPKTASASPDDHTLLFQFLNQIIDNGNEKKQLEAIRNSNREGAFSNAQDLFAALAKLLRQNDKGKNESKPNGLLSRILPGRGETADSSNVDLDAIRKRLSQLFSEIEIPVAYKDHVDHILEQLRTDTISLQSLLDDYIDLFVKIKIHLKQEQDEIQNFLSQLTGRLRNLEQQALEVNTSTQASLKDRDDLDSSVSEQVRSLQASTQQATDLQQLKQLIENRMATIAQQLEMHKNSDKQRQMEAEQKLHEMTQRLQSLEVETDQLRAKLRVVHDQSLRDTLTGLPNRQAYEERLEMEYKRWTRFRTPLSLVIWDVDFFKKINDRFGHQAGDKVLKTIANALADNHRQTDFVARYGGEEFVMLLSGANVEAALKIAEATRLKVMQCGFNSRGKSIPITVSCGISEFHEGDNPDLVFARADKALYQAKQSGRNRCVSA